MPEEKAYETFRKDLRFFSGNGIPVESILPYETMHGRYYLRPGERSGSRVRSLFMAVNAETSPVFLTTAKGLMQKTLPREELDSFAELLLAGEEADRDDLVEKLAKGGYVRSTVVEEVGEFCVRGGIVDVFTPLYEYPLRIEFNGDETESIRMFSDVNQRTVKKIEEAIILPATEVLIGLDRVEYVIRRLREHAVEMDISQQSVHKIVERLQNEKNFPGIEKLLPFVYENPDTVFDYFNRDTLFILAEPGKIEAEAGRAWEDAQKEFEDAKAEDRIVAEPGKACVKWEGVKERLDAGNPVSLGLLPLEKQGVGYRFGVHHETLTDEKLKRAGDDAPLAPLVSWLEENIRQGFATNLAIASKSMADRLSEMLKPYGVRHEMQNEFFEPSRKTGGVFITRGELSSGFVWPDQRLAVITDEEIFGKRRKRVTRNAKSARTALLSLDDLKPGDLVVHHDHGIGQFDGLIKLSLEGTENDFLSITYRDEDKLYLPVERMNIVQKYVGVESVTPELSKMGSKTWEKTKERIKKSVEKIAGELLKLYAERKVKKGHAFTDSILSMREFEDGFPYEETSDQLKAIEQVLEDMRDKNPMDRLICGDVGYGKTEVALRASFVCVNSGKQAAVLVPTTVLAQQHYGTFSERFRDYPIRVECLSRFKTAAQQREIVQNLKNGKTDIIIGTHRLLQSDIEFTDLGLVIVDEEQRFGVKQKENLKRMRSTVDVLSLTATPIPRTLHMSMSGIRDISVISTPPEQRHAIETYICEYDDKIVAKGIRDELERNGQIFFVHNNIHNIWSIAGNLKKLVPEVRLDVAHGRMDENELERVMIAFLNREIDMLVCTTIIESGLDIPAANTIMVNRADKFGLAQIYQLRGRVGRANVQAFAYLFVPEESRLGRDAQKRLKVLMEHSDLGSGFQIALSDLKIRGGGTILGASQSGHVAAVGYDMFFQLMENAMAELKGETVTEPLEPEINVSMSAYVPESYIPDIDQRMSVYRRLSRTSELRDISDIKSELTDRFGPLPGETGNLLLKIMLKVMAQKAGVRRLNLNGQKVYLDMSEAHMKNPYGIVDLIDSDPGRYRLSPNRTLTAGLTGKTIHARLSETKNLLNKISVHVN